MTTFTAEELIAAINAHDTVACSALLGLYARQTADEQEAQATGHRNGMGFNGTDAGILSSFAEQVLAWRATPERERRHRSPLSPKQLELVRKKIAKYGRQLVKIAEEKAAARSARAAGPAPTVLVVCERCDGHGDLPCEDDDRTFYETCPDCNGTGTRPKRVCSHGGTCLCAEEPFNYDKLAA